MQLEDTLRLIEKLLDFEARMGQHQARRRRAQSRDRISAAPNRRRRQCRSKPRAKRPAARPAQNPPRTPRTETSWADLLGVCGSLLLGGALAFRLLNHLWPVPSALPAGDAIDTAPVLQPDGRIVYEPRA